MHYFAVLIVEKENIVMTLTVCIGSSCHLKGSEKIVELARDLIIQNGVGDDVILSGCFCAARCNRTGVTVSVDDEVFEGITPEGFTDFFNKNVLERLK